MLIGAVANAILDPLFIYGFAGGMQIAAWVTVLAQGLSFAWCFAYFLRPGAGTRLRRRCLRL